MLENSNEPYTTETQLVADVNSPIARTGLLAMGRRVVRILGIFLIGQGTLQAIQFVIGFFLLRKLSIEAYAQFGLAYGFQVTLGSLTDLGFTSTIVPLVGEHRDNRLLVGRYVRAAKHWRDRTFGFLAPVTAICFLAIMYKHHWGWGLQLGLTLSVLITLYSSGRLSYFSTPLFIFGRLKEYYIPQTITAALRLIAYVACSAAGVLGAFVAAGLNSLTVAVNGLIIEKNAQPHMEWPEKDDPATDQEVLRYIIPAMPAFIFSAFQAQISLFLISIFGGTVSVAEVAALSKLAQLFGVLMTFNIMVIEPYIARRKRERLLQTYLGFIVLTTAICIPVVLCAFAVPAPFLWLLGGNYKNLGPDIGWVVLSACISHIAGLVWIMNRSRKWLFWSGTILEIALLLIVQSAYLFLVGVHTTRQAVFFTLASSFCYVAAHGYVGVLGFLKGPRIIHSPAA